MPGTMHYALYSHLALPAPSQPRTYVEWVEQREGGDKRGGGGRNVMKSFLYTIQERTKCWFPSLYFTNMSFLKMQVPHREVYTLKIKPRTNDQIHGECCMGKSVEGPCMGVHTVQARNEKVQPQEL